LIYGLIFGLVGALIAAYLSNSVSEKEYGVIGESSMKIMSAAKHAESVLFYIDQSAKYSLQQSVYELAENGGIAEIEDTATGTPALHECGKFKDSYVWYQITKTSSGNDVKSCFDDNSVTYNLPYLFNEKLNNYILNHPENILTDNYEYTIGGSLKIIGRAFQPLKFDIFDSKSNKDPVISGTEKIAAVSVPGTAMSCVRKAASTSSPSGVSGAAAADIPDAKIILPNTKPKETIKIETECMQKDLKGTISLGKDLIDFTQTTLCSKGDECIVTRDAFELILAAQELAQKKGRSLVVYGAYRTPETQQALWDGKTPERYAQRYPDVNIRANYVTNPLVCKNDVNKCSHYSGRAIDVRFKKPEWKMTNQEWKELAKVMEQAGWVRYANEAWHFECCGTDKYARAKAKGVAEIV